MFDALAKRYFDNPENYAEPLELYERYYTACKKYKTFEEMEQRFKDWLKGIPEKAYIKIL